MRIGTTAMQLSSLIPADLTPAEAISKAQNFSIVDQVREVAEQGFDLIELSTDLTLLLPDAYSPAVVADLAALKDELGLAYTVHLPLWSLELSAPLTPMRDGSVILEMKLFSDVLDSVDLLRDLRPAALPVAAALS
jgi:sugar phosphate isomerase/epimerase